MQVLINCFPLGYVNNLVARFWAAPLVGAYLSRILLADEAVGYDSYHGKTPEINGPHEFSYFWHKWLNISALKELDHEWHEQNQVDWPGLRRTLIALTNLWGRPVLMKGILPAYYLGELFKQMDLYVLYVERDLPDVAVSILEARREYYGDEEIWWSTKPLEYKRIKDDPYIRQIAAQVIYLDRFYKQQLADIPKDNLQIVGYQALCRSPAGVTQTVERKIQGRFGLELGPAGGDLPVFEPSSRKNHPDYLPMVNALEELGYRG
jgi:hypothetical protein